MTGGKLGSRKRGDQGEEITLTWMAMMMVVSEVRTRLELEPM